MTTPKTAHALALIAACTARIEGMKIANTARRLAKLSPSYDEREFLAEAGAMEQLAQEVINQ